MNPKDNIVIGLVIAALVFASFNVGVDPAQFVKGIPNVMIVVEEMVHVEPHCSEPHSGL